MNIPRRRRYDVVMVGGGHNGLVAAAYLAGAGKSCVVLERLDRFGGAAVSEEIFPGVPARLSRYSYLVSLLPQQIIEELRLPIHLLSRRISSYTPDPRADAARGLLVDTSDEAATRESFARICGDGGEFDRWKHFYGMTRRVARAVFPTLTEPLRSAREFRRLVNDEEAWEAIFTNPLSDVVSGTFRDDLVSGVVLTDGLIGTFSQSDARDLRQNRCFLYHVIGRQTGEWQVPLGGMGAVTASLADAAMSGGADLCSGCEVLAVEVRSDGVVVRYAADGEEHEVEGADVLVNTAPHELDRLLGESVQEKPEGAQIKVNLLLNRLPRLRDSAVSPEQAFAGTFHVNEMASQLDDAYQQATSGVLPSPVPCEAYCHSLTDPGILSEELQRQGVQTLTIFALQTPARLFSGVPKIEAPEALSAVMQSMQAVLAEPLEDCILRTPSGRLCVEVRTPLDIESELRLPAGNIFHRDLTWPFAEHEDDAGKWGIETAHPHVYLCGAGARRGGGVSGIPGRNAAMAVLGV